MRLEQLDRVAGGVVEQHLPATPALDDVAAQRHVGVTQIRDPRLEVGDPQLDALPATWFRRAAVGWIAAVAVYALVVGGALTVLATPRATRRPVAFAVTVLAAGVVLSAVQIPAGLDWFAPVLMIKLLLGHLLPGEERAEARATGDRIVG